MKKQMKKTVIRGLICLIILGMFLATLAPTITARKAPKLEKPEDPVEEINLAAGYNLITIPVVNDFTAETLGQKIKGCTAIIKFNADSQTYFTHPVGSPNDNFPIENGVAYYVYVESDTLFTIYDGDTIETVEVEIFKEWNTLGNYKLEPVSAEEIGQSIPGCTFISMLDLESGKYLGHTVGSPHDNFMIPPGQGIWAYSETKGNVWTGY